MQTITVNTRTKAGKIIFELATIFAKLDKGIIITQNGLSKPALKTNVLMRDFEIACKQLQESKLKKSKRKPLTQLLSEK